MESLTELVFWNVFVAESIPKDFWRLIQRTEVLFGSLEKVKDFSRQLENSRAFHTYNCTDIRTMVMHALKKSQEEVIGSCLFHSWHLYNSNLNKLHIKLFVLNFVATSLLKPTQSMHKSVETRSAIMREIAFRTEA